MAAPKAYGDSQARGIIGAVAASLHHSSWQHQILNSLSEARDQTCILMDTSRIRFCYATTGTLRDPFCYRKCLCLPRIHMLNLIPSVMAFEGGDFGR